MPVLQSTRPFESSDESSSCESGVDLASASATDEDLLDAWSRDKEVSALSLLVRRRSAMVLSVCRRRCHHACDADDAYQTTFLYLAKNAAKIRHPERLPGWLHRVAQRAAVATNRNLTIAGGDVINEITDPSSEPLDELGRRHNAILLDEELAELPEHYRSAIVLHLYGEQTIEQLAETLQATTGAVRGWLQRGKKLLAARLRRRGVVPVVAFAAAQSLSVSSAQAEAASQFISDPTGNATLPEPPLELARLDTAVDLGIGWTTTIVASGIVLGCVCLTAITLAATGAVSKQVLTIPSESSVTSPPILMQVGQSSGTNQSSGAKQSSGASQASKSAKKKNSGKNAPQSGSGGGSKPSAGRSWSLQTTVPIAAGKAAEWARGELVEPFNFRIDASLEDLPAELAKVIGTPVMFDDRGVQFAQVDLKQVSIDFQQDAVPLRTALKQMLAPHGLRATVEEDGIVITADLETLVHRGIGDSKWISIDQETAEAIAETLKEAAVVDFHDTPLGEAVEQIAAETGLPILIDKMALDDAGLTPDDPVDLSIRGVSWEDALGLLLDPYELTYTINGGVLSITTPEAADSALLQKIVWLEGTGVAAKNEDALIETIQASIDPDGWEALGGVSSMSVLDAKRPAIVVSTTYRTHREIGKFLKILRETHFGQSPVMDAVELPPGVKPRINSGGYGGGMGGGGLGGGGGGMGGGGGYF